MGSRDGTPDWACPNTECVNNQKLVFGSKAVCPKCGTPKDGPRQRSAEPRDDDWQCPNVDCKNHANKVFGKHMSCPACGTAKGAQKAGDWFCPNQGCMNHTKMVFGKNLQCPKCGCLRPQLMHGRGGMRGGPVVQAMQAMPARSPMGFGMAFGGGGFGAVPRGMMAVPQFVPVSMPMPGKAAAPGDWSCPNTGCQNHTRLVFAKNTSCPKCGASQPLRRPTDNPGAGGNDWLCPEPECQNHRRGVFGKHQACPLCGVPKPVGFTSMATGKPTDWACPTPDCINNRRLVFGKNDTCPQCGCPKPETASVRSFRSAPY
eukprot:TRINITY_DN115593_c0_g1_i1.p1 TRINITY_DN115593_c0_g1~~TRINITY_DN115593_c0_g1_i1.p1  ORF type:complete len:316 (-),score=49.29 TRINITY_DN115593_c0_g1_i1:240-1187(-)